MNIRKYASLAALCTGLFAQPTVAATATATSNTWQEIAVPQQQTVIVRGSKKKTIHPACAFSYFDSSKFHFFFRKGNTDKLVVFFDGGGACWNDKTCLTSLKQGASPAYSIAMNSPVGASGIADNSNKANPFKDWSQVFIPYCTGDIHIGSVDQNYTDVDGVIVGKNVPIKVQHRGFDNFLAVREWLKNRYHKLSPLKKLAVTGLSAGAYGAEFNFPYLHDTFARADSIMLADAGVGVVTQDFTDELFRKGGRWNTEETVVKGTKGFKQYGHFKANSFNANLMQDLAAIYPKSRFAQYTTAWDSIQTEYLHIMNSTAVGSPPNAVGIPWLATPPAATFAEWNSRAETSLTSIKASNYRFYLGSGAVHTLLGTNSFYNERSAENVLFSDWVKGLVANDRKNWQSVMCSGDCGSPI